MRDLFHRANARSTLNPTLLGYIFSVIYFMLLYFTFSHQLGPTERGVMVIKSKDKTRASQRKGALSNWKKTGKTVVKYLKKSDQRRSVSIGGKNLLNTYQYYNYSSFTVATVSAKTANKASAKNDYTSKLFNLCFFCKWN